MKLTLNIEIPEPVVRGIKNYLKDVYLFDNPNDTDIKVFYENIIEGHLTANNAIKEYIDDEWDKSTEKEY